ncbi:ankyrin repeat-containing domain protein [Umbelopsis sp. AD052]|nr:ankyrin repeat-containing domain protein [Umbelopsis sp. AD052]
MALLIDQHEQSLWKRLTHGIEHNDAEKVRQTLDEGDPSVLLSHTQDHVVLTNPGMFGDELDHINALQLAILKNKELIAFMIIEAVCKNQSTKSQCLNHRCAKGNTALHFAAFQNMHEIINMLLKAGANPYIRNDQRLRPLDCSHEEEAVLALTSQVRPYSPPASSFSSVLLQKAASRQQPPHTPPDITSSIPQDYFDSPPKSTRPRSKDSSISIPTPPPSPTRTCNTPTVVDNGARRARFTLQSVFIDSCMNGDIDAVQDTLSRGAKINARHGANDKSPLMIALVNDQENVARLLLSRQDININYQDSNGWSALHYTAAMSLWSLLNDMAMKEGVDLYSVNGNNELIEDCPEDRLDRTKCKAIIQRARQVQKNHKKPRNVSAKQS